LKRAPLRRATRAAHVEALRAGRGGRLRRKHESGEDVFGGNFGGRTGRRRRTGTAASSKAGNRLGLTKARPARELRSPGQLWHTLRYRFEPRDYRPTSSDDEDPLWRGAAVAAAIEACGLALGVGLARLAGLPTLL
jgi:hypothetical protein